MKTSKGVKKLTSNMKSPGFKPERLAALPLSTFSRYCSAGTSRVGLNSPGTPVRKHEIGLIMTCTDRSVNLLYNSTYY